MNRKIKTHNNANINATGTSLKGYVNAQFGELTAHFGPPFEGCDKTDWEWCLNINGVIVTIYNWKNGPNSGHAVGPADIREWNVGGSSLRAIEKLKSIGLRVKTA